MAKYISNWGKQEEGAIRDQLNAVLESVLFAHAERLARFLKFVVDETLSDRADHLNQYAIAIDVFDRDETFDPTIDAIVRVEAGRLRSKLLEYYDELGRDDPIRIELPKRSYAATFRDQSGSDDAISVADAEFGREVFSRDDLARTTVFRPDGDGTFFDAGYSAFSLTYARSLTDKFSVGVTGSLVHSGLDDLTANTLAFDLGTLYDTGFRSLKIGMSIQNMGVSSLSYIDEANAAKLPILFRVGAAINVVPALDHVVMTTAEFSHPPDNAERLNWGAEYGFKDFLFFRAGYNFGYDAESFSGGLGVQFPVSSATEMQFDYSYTDLGELSGSHRMSLEINF